MSTGTLLLNTNIRPEDPDNLLKQLLDYVQRCQRRYGGKNILATEFDSHVAGLCICLEAIFFHGIRTKPLTNQVNTALKQVSDIVAQSLNIKQESISFWAFIENHLTNHEQERFNILKHVWTDIGRCKAWIRASLNEKSLERYFHIVLSDKDILKDHYESWAILRDEDRNSMLPNMAAGLGSILFAISIDKLEFNVSIAPRPVLINHRDEPVIAVPIPDNKIRNTKSKKKVSRQIISFEDDDSVLSTSIPSNSSLSTCSDSSSLGNKHKVINTEDMENPHSTSNVMAQENVQSDSIKQNDKIQIHHAKKQLEKDSEYNEKRKGTRNLPVDVGKHRFSSSVPESLTPINQNNIGELTPVSVERIRDFSQPPESSDDILEVPTDISAVLTVVENKNLEEIRRRDERIKLLSKENDALKQQVKKYVGAIQMLRRDDESMQKALDGLQLETPPDYKGEAKVYEQKLVQVAEMHAELMDFNVMLQKTLHQKDATVERLTRELEELRGPMSADQESENSKGNVNIWIPSAFLTGSGSNSHHVYQIFLRAGNDEWNLYRRYAQFYALHSDLKKLDPAVGTFDFPPKKSIGKKDSSLVEERRKRLQIYLRKIIAHWPELAHCSNRFLLEQHLSFFKDQQEDEVKRNMFNSRRPGNSSHHSGL
ncbi:sorting nexin-29 isoform X2 [Euwallacea fornicatus]|uniref:sorting nexin-29 isoform X2 n=1 Tax=Euwallacea fornicatus TaxID=995702 RepID=UPI00338D3AD5